MAIYRSGRALGEQADTPGPDDDVPAPKLAQQVAAAPLGQMLPAQKGEEEGDEAWEGEDPGPPQPLNQEQILEEVEAAAAVEPLSDVQKVAFVRGKSIQDAVVIVAEHAVVV